MVTKYERQLERAEEAKRMRKHADEVHAVGSRLPFCRLDATGDEIVIRDLDGPPLVTFHGMYAAEMARWFELIGHRTAGMALAELIRACASSAEHVPGREAALRLLQEMKLEPKPTRYRRR
ncbi:hypothetical protein [Amycolatopsis australiensis]|uniref:Uncharacterized protein n=1 Tax=Amycolatopsis australiensis TaxID=546364 RepID=A0A1K1PRR4_9PSEU|nr:hypothetical protein [Amycolatopsis australiensis]SFW50249.1 hypothetical protein SAMN04489730_0930 [Amycolatopsis australiensis]